MVNPIPNSPNQHHMNCMADRRITNEILGVKGLNHYNQVVVSIVSKHHISFNKLHDRYTVADLEGGCKLSTSHLLLKTSEFFTTCLRKKFLQRQDHTLPTDSCQEILPG